MIAYIIIGIMLITWTTSRQVVKREDYWESMFCSAAWWAATIVCVLFWPLLVAWAVHDAIKELNDEGLA